MPSPPAQIGRQRYRSAVADFNRGGSSSPQPIPIILKYLAWFRATCSVALYRDGARPWPAKRACELPGTKTPGRSILSPPPVPSRAILLSAVKWEQKAIDVETRVKEKPEYGERLKLYQEKHPFREVKN